MHSGGTCTATPFSWADALRGHYTCDKRGIPLRRWPAIGIFLPTKLLPVGARDFGPPCTCTAVGVAPPLPAPRPRAAAALPAALPVPALDAAVPPLPAPAAAQPTPPPPTTFQDWATAEAAAPSCCSEYPCFCAAWRCHLLRAALFGKAFWGNWHNLLVVAPTVEGLRHKDEDAFLFYIWALRSKLRRVNRFLGFYGRRFLARAHEGFGRHAQHQLGVHWASMADNGERLELCIEEGAVPARPRCLEWQQQQLRFSRRDGEPRGPRTCRCLDMLHEAYVGRRIAFLCGQGIRGENGQYVGATPPWAAPCGCPMPAWAGSLAAFNERPFP